MIGTITLNPSVDQDLTVPKLIKDDAIRATGVEWFAAGKGVNVSRVIHELGGKGCAFGFVGGLPGQMLTRWLDQAGICHRFVTLRGDTRINTTLTDLSDRSQTHVRVPGPRVTKADQKELHKELARYRPRPKFWALGGSLPRGVPNGFYRQLILRLERTGARCVLDTDDEALTQGLDATPFMIKPNEHEFERLTGVRPTTDRAIVRAGRRLAERGTEVILVTLGPRGAVVVTRDDVFRVNTPRVKVKSKIGAGDSTIAGTLVALEKGASLREAVRCGIAAGTAAVLTEGTKLCERREVERLLPRIKITPVH